ncbi:PP2C family protein-serine/threonine phosphatase [Streptomyces qinglanensis]|uniref:PP2C family protein-serine/threonine phosphatase n=1 Tax=Streptomyces qinglanensis TaxID=943816 RepID=UPI00378ECB66
MREWAAGAQPVIGYGGNLGRLWRLARWLPAALCALGVALDFATPRDVTVSAPFAAAPLAAAAFLTLRGTVLTGMFSSGATILFSAFHDSANALEAEARSITIVTVSVLAIGVNYVLVRSGSRLASARSIAEAVQYAVLPAPPSRVGALTVATRYRAAQAEARIGGDFYAAEETPYGVRLLLGDVRGKGLDAVASVVLLVGVFREAAEQEATLPGVAARLDRALQRDAHRLQGAARLEDFSTAVLVEIVDACPQHPAPPASGASSTTPEDSADSRSSATPPAPDVPAVPAGSGASDVPPSSSPLDSSASRAGGPLARSAEAPGNAAPGEPGPPGGTPGPPGGPDAGDDGAAVDRTAGDDVLLRVVNRGHPAPVLLHRGRATLLEPTIPALPLGMTDLGVWHQQVDEFAFPPGAQLLLYTDGLSEARNPEGDFYQPAQRLSRACFADPEELLATILADVAAHTGGQSADDMALLAVARDTSREPSRDASDAAPDSAPDDASHDTPRSP